MTRLRIYRGIATLASLAAISTGPQAALAGETSSSSPKVSSRFLNSLEQADPLSVEDNNHAPLESHLAETEYESIVDGSDQRRQLSWWSIALQLSKLQ
mmetsp:Transcript_36613/g.59768  ORF Transcript_36613/g.59768 Transcript_36613/m.59768 type:complete len:98 (+) Transcript_36613:123-416(+)